MCKRFVVIGITDSREPELSSAAMEAVGRGTVFSGGKRHHEIVGHLLPADHEWIDVTVPLDEVFKKYASRESLTVFASGDPLFYGFGGTLQRRFPDAEIEVIPAFNSLQMLAHALVLPYQDMSCVSLTGRDWDNFDSALIHGLPMIGVLTDRRHTPAAIARRMLDYGYDNYSGCVGENMGNGATQRVLRMSLDEMAAREFAMPNCLILIRSEKRERPFGIPDAMFAHLPGREKMITKMPIRLLSLSMLDLRNRREMWDVGFCTGSVSVEAKLQFPDLHITAFERREESRELFEINTHRFGTPDIECVIGDFFEADLTVSPHPDAVFIGGHGGRLGEMVERISKVLRPGGVVVFNSVSDESCATFEAAVVRCGMSLTARHRVALDDYNPIVILRAE